MALYYGRTVNDIAQEMSCVNNKISRSKIRIFLKISLEKI